VIFLLWYFGFLLDVCSFSCGLRSGVVLLHTVFCIPQLAHIRAAAQKCPASLSSFETLPVEVVNHILSYLVHPRSRLPGLTEAQSSAKFSAEDRTNFKKCEDLTTPADSNRWAADIFQNHLNRHPFHTLSLTSRRCNELVESYSGHLVRSCNLFNLPFAQFDRDGAGSVWPDMSGIVYRRLWLQHAPRKCIYCDAVMDLYPFPILKRLLSNCENCFYRQALVCTSLLISRAIINELRLSTRLTASTTSRRPLSLQHMIRSEDSASQFGSCASMLRASRCRSMALGPSTTRTRNSSASLVLSVQLPGSRHLIEA
jgi:hypothetical protein